jgi:phenol 2-monooxygenase
MDPETDLLICGAGPTGLMLALWATKYDIKVRIIDSKAERVQTGHAYGFHSRTLEILDSFDLIDGFLSKSCRINEICAWVRML